MHRCWMQKYNLQQRKRTLKKKALKLDAHVIINRDWRYWPEVPPWDNARGNPPAACRSRRCRACLVPRLHRWPTFFVVSSTIIFPFIKFFLSSRITKTLEKFYWNPLGEEDEGNSKETNLHAQKVKTHATRRVSGQSGRGTCSAVSAGLT